MTENRTWIEAFFEGDLMHTQTVNLPTGTIFDVYVEAVPHKTTVYEHPRTMIFFAGPCDLEVTRDGNKVIVMGAEKGESSKWSNNGLICPPFFFCENAIKLPPLICRL